jgi:uncharacterized protein
MALWKSGLLAAKWPSAQAIRLGLWLIGLCAVPLALLAAFAIHTGFNPAIAATNALVWSAPFDLVMAVGMAALFVPMLQRAGARNWWASRFAAAGRMALTNYLGASVVFGAVFASWGLGLFGTLDRVAVYGVALGAIALMLTLSPFWLARYRQGPVEWLWRGLAQGQLAPLRR